MSGEYQPEATDSDSGELVFQYALSSKSDFNVMVEGNAMIRDIETNLTKLQEVNIRKAMSYLYEVLETSFIDRRFKVCDYFYEHIEIEKFQIPILVSLLSISFRWRKVLIKSDSFFFKVEKHIKSILPAEEAASVLEGFEA